MQANGLECLNLAQRLEDRAIEFLAQIDFTRNPITEAEPNHVVPKVCITRDNVQVHVDGVLYLKVLNPERASYGVSDYLFAISQLAQTTLRSEVGKIDLDRTFEERSHINTQVVNELDKASEPWGIKVLRYEIKNISPPTDVLAAMEKQMRAEREKRAVILSSEGERDAVINTAEGQKQQVIKASEARDVDRIMTFFAADCTFYMARGPEPCGRRVHGRAEVRRVLADRFAVIPDMRWDHVDHFITGSRAATVWTVTGRGKDGEVLEYRGCDLYEFRGDKILNKDTYWKIVEQRERL